MQKEVLYPIWWAQTQKVLILSQRQQYYFSTMWNNIALLISYMIRIHLQIIIKLDAFYYVLINNTLLMLRNRESSTVLSAIFKLLIQFSWQKSVKQQKKVVLFSACFSKCQSAAKVLWSFSFRNQTLSFVFDVDQISSLLNPGKSLSLHTKWRDVICPLPELFSRTTVNSFNSEWDPPLVFITGRACILLLFGATESCCLCAIYVASILHT